jgi:putative transposase
VGAITGTWVSLEQKVDILSMTEQAKEKGVSITRTCALWKIERRRVVHWRRKQKRRESLDNSKPGPRYPSHALLPEEKTAIVSMARQEQYADLSHRILAATAWDLNLFFVSFSSVYRILHAAHMITMRGIHKPHNGLSLPPVRKEITGANQRWCWDISYLPTHERGIFLYLYLLLDEYSRKAISWLISWHQTAQEARSLLEEGLSNENILDLPEEQRPEIINDRGRQMKAKSIKRMFEDHAMPQLFSRPRTPNDNPFVESCFGTVKTAPQYPGCFLDREEAIAYFTRYFLWYNHEHLHSGIEYVTPDQCHRGLREAIVARRTQKLQQQQHLRKEVNRLHQNALTGNQENVIVTVNRFTACSVMTS